MAHDRTDGTLEKAEEQPAAEQQPAPDRPGAEGVPSRAESRKAVSVGEQVKDQPADDKPGKEESEVTAAPQESADEQDTDAAEDTAESSEPVESSTEGAGEQTETPGDETTVERSDAAEVADEGTEQPPSLTETGTAQDDAPADADATGSEEAAEPADSVQAQEDEDSEDTIPAEGASETAEPLPDDSEAQTSHPEDTSEASSEGEEQGVKEFEETTPADRAEPVEPLTDAEYAEHVREVTDKLDEARTQERATDHGYTVDPDRQEWSKDRNRIHREIVTDVYAKAVDVPDDHCAVIAGGLGGAGKSTVLENYAGIDQSQYLTINPDDIKEEMARRNLIPEVEGLSPMEASDLVHEESSYIAKRLAMLAQSDGKNMIWDITMSSPESTEKRIEALRDAGYRHVEGVFVDIPVETSVERAQSRHRRGHEAYRNGKGEGGRYVPDEVILANEEPEWGSVNRKTFEQLKHRFDAWSIYDNSVDGRAPVLMESSDREEDEA